MTCRHDGADGTLPAKLGSSAQYAGRGLVAGALVLLLLAATPGHADARDRHNPWLVDRPGESGSGSERSRHRFPEEGYDPSRRGAQTGSREWPGPPSRDYGRTPGAPMPGSYGSGAYPYSGSYPGWQGGSGYAPLGSPSYGMPWGISPFGGFPFP